MKGKESRQSSTDIYVVSRSVSRWVFVQKVEALYATEEREVHVGDFLTRYVGVVPEGGEQDDGGGRLSIHWWHRARRGGILVEFCQYT